MQRNSELVNGITNEGREGRLQARRKEGRKEGRKIEKKEERKEANKEGRVFAPRRFIRMQKREERRKTIRVDILKRKRN